MVALVSRRRCMCQNIFILATKTERTANELRTENLFRVHTPCTSVENSKRLFKQSLLDQTTVRLAFKYKVVFVLFEQISKQKRNNSLFVKVAYGYWMMWQ